MSGIYTQEIIQTNKSSFIQVDNNDKLYLKKNQSALSSFINWAASQDAEKRFFWLAMSLLANMAIAVPITIMAIQYFANNNFTLISIAAMINAPMLGLTLAGQPTKVTIPALFLVWAIDLALITTAIYIYIG